MPLKTLAVSSGFGLRADPFDQPWARTVPMGPLSAGAFPAADWKPKTKAAPQPLGAAAYGLKPSPLGPDAKTVNSPTPLGLAMGLAPPTGRVATASRGGLAMHEGVDLVAAPGTPIMAAADGIVVGAEPKGRYGNWIEIVHDGKLATVYGHLSAFAPGIATGVRVEQGDVIGFTGMTGRTTGPHLHFEILTNGRPTNPIANPATKRAQLRGPDMVQFKKVVTRDVAEREREAKSM